MKRKYVNFIFDANWNYVFPEDDIIEPSAIRSSSSVAIKTMGGEARMVIQMSKVVALEFFEKDFEAEAEERRQAEEQANAEPGSESAQPLPH